MPIAVSTSPLTKPAKYEKLAVDLRRQIEDGRLKPGDRLPSFPEMRLQHGISQSTLERTHQILEQQGLIVRKQGRGIFVAQTNQNKETKQSGWMQDAIAVVTPHQTELAHEAQMRQEHQKGFLKYITQGIIGAIEQAGLHALSIHPDRIEDRHIRQLIQDAPRGLVLTDLKNHSSQIVNLVSTLHTHGVPLVICGGATDLNGYDRVVSDHEFGSYKLTQWLIKQQRQRILMLWTVSTENYWYPERRAGYERAMREAGLEPMDTLEVSGISGLFPDAQAFATESRQLGAALIEYVTGTQPIDALMLHTDGTVSLAASALRLFGKEPNQDIAIVGYDNYWKDSDERKIEPCFPLATVDKLNQRIGQEAVHLLLDRIKGILPPAPQCRVVKPKLVLASESDSDSSR